LWRARARGVHDDDHQRSGQPARAPLRTLESYGPDAAATFIGTTVLDMLRALHPDVFVPFPNLIAPTEE
jgi:hypothetical protein